ncbi:Nuclear pore complex protein [Thalictrum thalictroides]|uniref:Nuclear pore complex protein n=1 Tax=Thalictrum thalictroides TaxID=46969 RepID=A0A7J6X540_THATH|nr:Nuclear pore complex protein [Thalictrum thalictroides]
MLLKLMSPTTLITENRQQLLATVDIQSKSLPQGTIMDGSNDATSKETTKRHNMIEKLIHTMEDLVADQLFQSAEHSLDGLSWTSLSLSSVKDQIVPFVSSIFLRRLLQPGIYQNATLRATVHDYNKLWSDSEFQSLTVDGLKKEIFSLIEGEVAVPMSIIYCWKKFCRQYFHYWCKNNALYGLLFDPSTGAIGLIRKNTISLFRCLEGIELLIYGSFDEFGDFANSGLNLPNDFLDREILFEVLRCISNIHQQLGKAGSAIFYESLVNAQLLSSEEVVPGFLKILETGYSSSAAKLHVSQFGADNAWKKELEDHRNQRKFSIDMLLSLHALLDKAASWDRVLNVIEHFLRFLILYKRSQSLDAEAVFNINSSALVLSTSQVARVMFESAFDILLLLGYLVNVRGQIHMMCNDISKIQLELIPMIQEILTEWVILHFLGTTPTESPPLEDFSTRLSSLHIDSSTIRRSWNEKLGTCDFTLACLLFLCSQNSPEDLVFFSSRSFPGPKEIISTVHNFSSWVIWGGNRPIELGMILLRHGQYEAVENLFGVIDAHSRKERTSESAQDSDGEWCKYLHLLGFCLLARAQCELHGVVKERKIREAVRCFFRASSGLGASQALQSLSFEGLPHLGYTSCGSEAEWKLRYYQWAMQIFEQYNLSEGACQFALSALEQVDEILGSKYNKCGGDLLNESATTVRGRLWANVFKFTLDLNHYYDAYCAIISNPDEDSKHICLRRFVIVLCERGAYETLCDGQLPFVGLTEKMEQELAWKAERSDVVAKPNPYKLLYAFEMHRHNWRRAASYMYRYSVRLRSEVAFKEHQHRSMALQERLNGLSAAINALNLVHPDYAWIDPQLDGYSCLDDVYPNKKARKVGEESSLSDSSVQSWRLQYCVDCEKLEQEYVQTSAEHSLSLANVKPIDKGNQANPSGLVDLLVQTNLYDMAFTVLLKFWKGSELKRELERVFVAIALKCCPNSGVSSMGTHGLLLTASEEESYINSAMETSPSVHQSKGNSQWETLEQYLGKYMKLHPRLPVTVAETLLHTDPQMELPLWLVLMFKGGRRATSWGMTGLEANPGSLFSLYVDYGRFTEATNLLLEYIESFSSLRPADIMNRKKMSAIWFPYTTIERLWCQLEETKSSGHMIDQCDQLKRILRGALHSHLKLVEVDSHDAVSSAA